MAAAPSSVPADREEAFVCSTGSTVNNIGWHGLECGIIVFFVVVVVLIETRSKWGTLWGQLKETFCSYVQVYVRIILGY